jgi:hypothetical protein
MLACTAVCWTHNVFAGYCVGNFEDDGGLNMKCRSCGQEIEWVTTVIGKRMPVNPEIVNIIEDKSGDTLIIADDNRVKRGYCVGDAREGGYITGRVSHFATCPHAAEHRKGGKS